MYQDGKLEEIEDYRLDDLIRYKKIKKFQRSGEWVTIGVDPIRAIREDYLEVPRRQKWSKRVKKSK